VLTHTGIDAAQFTELVVFLRSRCLRSASLLSASLPAAIPNTRRRGPDGTKQCQTIGPAIVQAGNHPLLASQAQTAAGLYNGCALPAI
jgi:hypothetical protein